MDKTIGIFGGGQLGRMMAQAALPLNIQCTFFEASTDCPSSALGPVISTKARPKSPDSRFPLAAPTGTTLLTIDVPSVPPPSTVRSARRASQRNPSLRFRGRG